MPKKNFAHPFQLGAAYNEQMKCWDVIFMMGGFKSKEDADANVEIIKAFVIGEDGEHGFADRTQ